MVELNCDAPRTVGASSSLSQPRNRPSRSYSEGSFFWRESKRWRYLARFFL